MTSILKFILNILKAQNIFPYRKNSICNLLTVVLKSLSSEHKEIFCLISDVQYLI